MPVGSWPPVMATAPLYSSLNVMFTPAATANWTPNCPEWA